MAKKNEFEAANQRAKELQDSTPKAVSAHYDVRRGRIVVQFMPNLEVSFSLEEAQGLGKAHPSQLEPVEITPSGLGLHFPKLDADIYIPALLAGVFGSRKWMAARLGQAGGRSRSRAKQKASKANGKLGGRPRKVVAR